MMINALLSDINVNGVMKPNKYVVFIKFPQAIETLLVSRGFNIFGGLSSRIERVTLPGDNLAVSESYPSQSQGTQSIATGREKPEGISFSVVLSQDAREREMFLTWMRYIYGKTDGSFQPKFHDDYVGFVKVYLLNNNNIPVNTYSFYDAFPKMVGEVELSYSEENTYGTCAITFVYSREDTISAQDRIIGGIQNLL